MGKKHLGKEKVLILSNFSFSHNVFKRLVQKTRNNQGLFGKGLNDHEKKGFHEQCWKNEKSYGNKDTFSLFPTLFSTFRTLSETNPGFMCLQYKSLETILGKGEIASFRVMDHI